MTDGQSRLEKGKKESFHAKHASDSRAGPGGIAGPGRGRGPGGPRGPGDNRGRGGDGGDDDREDEDDEEGDDGWTPPDNGHEALVGITTTDTNAVRLNHNSYILRSLHYPPDGDPSIVRVGRYGSPMAAAIRRRQYP